MPTNEADKRVDILLAEYRAVSQELTLYISELFRCVLYGAALAAAYIGIGLSSREELSQMQRYVPYAFVLLIVYFLAISTIRINLSGQRAALETALNRVAGVDGLLSWESSVAKALQSRGVMRWRGRRIPTPMLLLGIILVASAFGLLATNVNRPEQPVVAAALLACTVLAGYVFFWYPQVARSVREAESRRTRDPSTTSHSVGSTSLDDRGHVT